MTALLIGALAFVVLLLLARGYTRTDPRMLASGVRAAIVLGAIVAISLLAIWSAVRRDD